MNYEQGKEEETKLVKIYLWWYINEMMNYSSNAKTPVCHPVMYKNSLLQVEGVSRPSFRSISSPSAPSLSSSLLFQLV